MIPPSVEQAPRIGSLFTGAGALCELAVAPLLGGRVVWHCENDPAASTVLAHRFPDTPNFGDITAVDWSAVEPVDVLAGGFPCQDISSAGRRAGIEGDRSGLWSYFADAIRLLRPHLVLVENVSALVVRGLGRILADLSSLGFDAEWAVARASDVGAPHRRERVFIAAADAARPECAWPRRARRGGPESSDGGRSPLADAAGKGRRPFEPEHVVVHSGTAVRAGQAQPGRCDRVVADPGRVEIGEQPVAEPRGDGPAESGLDHPPAAEWGIYELAVRRWERVLGRVAPSPTVVGKRGGKQLNPVFVEWMMGWPAGHVTAVPGLSRNAMLRLCGNGVVPQQATAAFTHLLPLLLSSERRAAS